MRTASARDTLIEVARSVCTGAGTFAPERLDSAVWELATRAGLAQLLVASAATGSNWTTAELPRDARAVIRWAGMNHLHTLAELRTLAALLDGAGVRWLVFKGPVLADVVYFRRGLRIYGDLDVLIHPADLPTALDALLESNIELIDRNWAHIRRTEQSEISLRLPFGTALDLHWHVISNPAIRAQIRLPVLELFDAAIDVQLGGRMMRTLDPIDTLCHLCLHAALSGGHQLRWLVDIQQTVTWAQPDPAELVRRSSVLGCELVVAVMLQRVASHLDRGVLPLLRAVRRRSSWTVLCAMVDSAVGLDPDDTAYSGRAIFSSTRSTSIQSLGAAAQTLRSAVSLGRDRRGRAIDASILRDADGSIADRDAWLDMAGAHA